jgi:hypothetical protein
MQAASWLGNGGLGLGFTNYDAGKSNFFFDRPRGIFPGQRALLTRRSKAGVGSQGL